MPLYDHTLCLVGAMAPCGGGFPYDPHISPEPSCFTRFPLAFGPAPPAAIDKKTDHDLHGRALFAVRCSPIRYPSIVEMAQRRASSHGGHRGASPHYTPPDWSHPTVSSLSITEPAIMIFFAINVVQPPVFLSAALSLKKSSTGKPLFGSGRGAGGASRWAFPTLRQRKDGLLSDGEEEKGGKEEEEEEEEEEAVDDATARAWLAGQGFAEATRSEIH